MVIRRPYGTHALWQALFLLVLCLGVGLSAGEAPTVEAKITDISGTAYFPAVHRELQNAGESIYVTMFLISCYPHSNSSSPTVTLVQDLIRAHERGVKVTVILDKSFRYKPKMGSMGADLKNNVAAQMLSDGGIDVRYASTARLLHQKLIVIDGKIVISGSHNWSDSALKYNLESSELIRSAEYARIKLKAISEIPLLPLEPQAAQPGSFVEVPVRLLTEPDLVPTMITRQDHRLFDLFLLILRQSLEEHGDGEGQITVDYDAVAADLGMDLGMGRTAYRRQISKVLRKLESRYRLAVCRFKYGKPAAVSLKAGRLYEGAVIDVPVGYWEYGWNRKLSLPAKAAYLMCLAEQESSETKPWWSLSRQALARKYSGSPHTVGKALRELEVEDILEIVRSKVPPGGDFAGRRPNSYRVKPLLPPEDIEKEWMHLTGVYGEKNLEKARELAGRIDRGNNRHVVSNLLAVMDRYGIEETEKATDIVAQMVPDNPCRHVGYIVTLLKDWRKEQ